MQSNYLNFLPEIYQGNGSDESGPFLGEFLKIFEAILSGRDDAFTGAEHVQSLVERIEGFDAYIDASTVPLDNSSTEVLSSDFLNYLASWFALTIDQSWDMSKKRLWMSRISALYKRRGTLEGIDQYLKVFVGNQATIDELNGGFVIGETSTIGDDTFIAGAPAYFFRVRIAYAFGGLPFDIHEWKNIRRGTRAIVDLEKPAHTYYTLDSRTPGFIINLKSTVGGDTLLWEKSQKFD